MSKFLTKCVLEATDDHDETGNWIVHKALVYLSDVACNTIIVPRGFVTDLASVPRLPVLYALDGGKAIKAAVLHDWLYDSAMYPRAMADAIFREAMEVSGVGFYRRWRFWMGVRLDGWRHYRDNSDK